MLISLKKHLRKIVLLLVLAVIFISPEVNAQTVQTLQSEIKRLNNAIIALEKTIYRLPNSETSTGGNNDSLAIVNIKSDIQELNERMRNLFGKIEELQHMVRQTNLRLDRSLADISMQNNPSASNQAMQTTQPALSKQANRTETSSSNKQNSANNNNSQTLGTITQSQLDAVEQAEPVSISGGFPLPKAQEPTAPPPQPEKLTATEAPTPVQASNDIASAVNDVQLPSGTTQEQYDFAFNLLKRRNYADAQAAFENFIINNSSSNLLSAAQYWIGESHYARSDYQNAIVNFLKVYENYSESHKAPDSLLKLGLSLAALNKIPEACASWQELIMRYPSASARTIKRTNHEISERCGS